MFNERCRNCFSPSLLLCVAITSGCGGSTAVTESGMYRASLESTRDLSPVQARNLLLKEANAAQCSLYGHEKRVVTVTHAAMRISCEDSQAIIYRFAEEPELQADLTNKFANRGVLPSVYGVVYAGTDPRKQMFIWLGAGSHSQARNLVKAWYVWAREAPALYQAQEIAFEKAAQSYRVASGKPSLPEEAVRFKTQAEFAVKQHRLEQAVDLFDQALNIAPWWPAGHYNRGLILGELKDYTEGIASLQKYLKLEPDAANARAVQNKIYEWEILAPAGSK